MTTLVIVALVLAALPAVMTCLNTLALKTPPRPEQAPAIAILVPARDEEASIGACVDAALASVGADIEVVVLDDGSTDRTAAIVRDLASRDGRVRLETAPPLPAGWNGKQHACHVLSGLTDRPILLFIDADVRLAPDGAARLSSALEGADLVSGVPRQIMESTAERIVIPMINALILGYLPVPAMRWSRRSGFAAGCGQLMMARREAYRAVGGHGAIGSSLHDGLKLPRLFRAGGRRTDLVDGTRLAECRMYGNGPEIVRGFLKNATEGMARPVALPVWTVLLFGGHILPWLLLVGALATGERDLLPLIVLACLAPLAARLLQAVKCREPLLSVLLHPLGVAATLAIQWTALVRRFAGAKTAWRGRAYQAQS